jgi:hypothetical protein
MEKCRLCLTENSIFTHLSEIREGVSLSLIAMTICPIMIEMTDVLPKQICARCLEILLAAYQLRSTSLQSELYLRELTETYVKEEPLEEENPIHFESPKFEDESNTSLELPETTQSIAKPIKYSVDCFKTVSRSFVWKHFGALIDGQGDVIDDSSFYCKHCVKRNELIKYSKENATSCFSSHLHRIHNISKPAKTVKEKVEVEKSDEVFSCSLCDKKLVTKVALKRHIERKHEPKRDPKKVIVRVTKAPKDANFIVDCFKPRKALNSSLVWNFFGRLLDSDGKEVESSRGFYYCRLCNESKILTQFSVTNATTGLMNHLVNKHGISPDMKAEDFEAPLREEQSNTVLLRVGDKGATCLSCNESFDTGKAYYNHLRSVHDTIEASNYVCHVCSKTFSKNYILTKHMKIHSGVNYFCAFCPASFSYPEGLKRHEKIHDPSHLSKFQCDQCPNSYAERKSLKLHILTVHLNQTQERNFKCDVCGMRFITSNNLKKHLLKHTGEVRKVKLISRAD